MSKNKTSNLKQVTSSQKAGTVSVSSAAVAQKLSRQPCFPMLISLEGCSMTVTNGHHADVLSALHSFSVESKHNQRNPHKLKKSGNKMKKWFDKVSDDSIFSLDIKSNTRGRGNKRLFYTRDCLNGVMFCKILALCSEDSHEG